MRRKFEKPQEKNPYELTVNQHVWPKASIACFAGSDGTVELFDIIRNKTRQAKPSDPIFCAKRAWDQRAEAGYMRQIEDAFQNLAASIIAATASTIDATDKEVVDSFFALWRMRADHKFAPDEDVQFKGVTGGDWSKDQEEQFEKAGALFLRKGGTQPARMMHGLRIQMGIDKWVEGFTPIQWGIIQSAEAQFIVPDYPKFAIVPVSPTICLCTGGQNISIAKRDVAKVNTLLRSMSKEYFFAQDLARCPFLEP